MAKEKEENLKEILILDDSHKKMFLAIVENKMRAKLEAELAREDVKGLAEKLNVTPGEINSIVGLVMKEQEKGGAVRAQSKIIDYTEQVLGE